MMLVRHLPNANGEIPLSVATGQTPDISKFMHFHFWQDVFVESHDRGKKEEHARWCYPAENVGDELTYMVLLSKSNRLVPRSNVRPANDPLYPNYREQPAPMSGSSGEEVKSGTPIYNMQDKYNVPLNLPRFAPDDLIGQTFLYNTTDDQ